MSGEEELGLIEAAAFRYARKRGVTMREAERISTNLAKGLRIATEFEVEHASPDRVGE